MSPLEIKEEQQEKQRDFKALKTFFGHVLLENRGLLLTEGRGSKPTDKEMEYFTRKFKEAVAQLRR